MWLSMSPSGCLRRDPIFIASVRLINWPRAISFRWDLRVSCMTFRRFLAVVFAAGLLPILGCQPDQRAPDWSPDAGHELPGNQDAGDGGDEDPTALWNGEWESMSPTRGGLAFAKLDGELLVSNERAGREVSAVTSDGEAWRDPSSSPIASRVNQGSEHAGHYYAEAGGQRYLLTNSGELYRAAVGSDDWQTFDGFEKIEHPHYVGSVGDTLVIGGARGIYVHRQDGTLEDITPEQAAEILPRVNVVGSRIFTVESAAYVSEDVGETWQFAEGLDAVQAPPQEFTSFEGTLYAVGQEHLSPGADSTNATQYLVRSDDGSTWDSVRLNHDVQVALGDLVVVQGSLYTTDDRGRLLRMSTDGSIETVTEPNLDTGETGELYRVGSRLVTSLGRHAVATWQPGDSRWSVAAVGQAASVFETHNGGIWARSGVVQSIGQDGWQWKRDWERRRAQVWSTSNGLLGFDDSDDCLLAAGVSDWGPTLQWNDNGISQTCTGEDTAGKMTDAVGYKDGVVVGRNSELLTTGGPPGNGDEFGKGGLIYWNLDTGEAENLAPLGLESERPGVRGLANADGTLWVQSEVGKGIPGNDGTLYRVEDGSWTKIEPDVIGRDGTRYEEFTFTRRRRIRSYDSHVIAEVMYSESRESEAVADLARWNAEAQAFEVIEVPTGDVADVRFTELGPVIVASDTLWRYRVERVEWQQIGQALPTAGEHIAHVTAEPGAFYLNAQDGSVWVTRPTTGNE